MYFLNYNNRLLETSKASQKHELTLHFKTHFAEKHMWNHIFSPAKTITCSQEKKSFPCTVALTCKSFISSQFKGRAYFPLWTQSGIPSEFSSREIAGYVNVFWGTGGLSVSFFLWEDSSRDSLEEITEKQPFVSTVTVSSDYWGERITLQCVHESMLLASYVTFANVLLTIACSVHFFIDIIVKCKAFGSDPGFTGFVINYKMQCNINLSRIQPYYCKQHKGFTVNSLC